MGMLFKNGAEIEVQPRNGKIYSLAELQEYVEGYIEIVWLKDGRLMIVDEEGALKENYLNGPASRLAGRMIFGHALVINEDEIE